MTFNATSHNTPIRYFTLQVSDNVYASLFACLDRLTSRSVTKAERCAQSVKCKSVQKLQSCTQLKAAFYVYPPLVRPLSTSTCHLSDPFLRLPSTCPTRFCDDRVVGERKRPSENATTRFLCSQGDIAHTFVNGKIISDPRLSPGVRPGNITAISTGDRDRYDGFRRVNRNATSDVCAI